MVDESSDLEVRWRRDRVRQRQLPEHLDDDLIRDYAADIDAPEVTD